MLTGTEPATPIQPIVNLPPIVNRPALPNPGIAPLGENIVNPNRRYRNPPPGEEFVREISPEVTCKEHWASCIQALLECFRMTTTIEDQYEMQPRTPETLATPVVPDEVPRNRLPPLRGPLPLPVVEPVLASQSTSLNSSRDPVTPMDPELPIVAPLLHTPDDEPGPSSRDPSPSQRTPEPLNPLKYSPSPVTNRIEAGEDPELPVVTPLLQGPEDKPGSSSTPEPAAVRAPNVAPRIFFTAKRHRYMSAEELKVTVPDRRLEVKADEPGPLKKEDPELPIVTPLLNRLEEDHPGPSNEPEPAIKRAPKIARQFVFTAKRNRNMSSEPLTVTVPDRRLEVKASEPGPSKKEEVLPPKVKNVEDPELPIFAPLLREPEDQTGPSNEPKPAMKRALKIERRFNFTAKRNRYMPAEQLKITVPDRRLGVKADEPGPSKKEETPPSKPRNPLETEKKKKDSESEKSKEPRKPGPSSKPTLF